MTPEQIKKRIEELQANRQQFALQAQMELASYNGAIQELERLLAAVRSVETGNTTKSA